MSQESRIGESVQSRRLGKKSDAWANGPMTADGLMEVLRAKEHLKVEKDALRAEKVRVKNENEEQMRLDPVKLVEELKCIVLEQVNWESRPNGRVYIKYLESVLILVGRKRLRDGTTDLIEEAKKTLKWNEEEKSFAEPPPGSVMSPWHVC